MIEGVYFDDDGREVPLPKKPHPGTISYTIMPTSFQITYPAQENNTDDKTIWIRDDIDYIQKVMERKLPSMRIYNGWSWR